MTPPATTGGCPDEDGRNRAAAFAASPTMVGAITTLIVLVAVFLATTRTTACPSCPSTGSRRRSATRPASAPTTRSGSAATGSASVESIETVSTLDEAAAARPRRRLQRLDRGQAEPEARRERRAAAGGLDDPGALPLLLRAQVPGDRPRRRRTGLPEGGTLAARNSPSSRPSSTTSTTPSTPRPARTAARCCEGFGNALRGPRRLAEPGDRGAQPAVREPASGLEGARRTRPPHLARFFPELADAARIVAPVADDNAELFTNAAIAFGAISSDEQALRDSISGGGHRARGGRRSRCPVQQPFLRGLRRLLAPAAPRRTRPADLAAGPERGGLDRLQDAAADGADEPGPRGRAGRARATWWTSRRTRGRRLEVSASGTPSTPAQRRRARSALPDGLQLLELLVHLPHRALHRARTQFGFAERVALVGAPGLTTPDEAPRNPLDNYAGGQADGRFSQLRPARGRGPVPTRASSRSCTATPTGRAAPTGPQLPGRPDRLRARRGPDPRPGPGQPRRSACSNIGARPESRARQDRPLPGSRTGHGLRGAMRPGGETGASRTGASALIAIVLVVIGFYLAFAKSLPFAGDGYQLKAVFDDAQNIRAKSPVRIAGVEVGEVTEVEHLTDGNGNGPDAAVVTMNLDDERACRSARTRRLQLRPRLFLEGNLFVDLQPGSPGAAELDSGSVVPLEQTSVSVQFDQVLTSLQAPVRQDLQIFLKEFGERARQVRRRRGLPRVLPDLGARGLQVHLAGERGAARHRAGRPRRRHPQPRRVAAALDRNEVQLQDLVTNLRHRHRVVRGRGAPRSSEGDRRAAAACWPSAARRSSSSTPTSRRCAPSPERRCRVSEAAEHGARRREPLDRPAPRAGLASRSCAAWSRTCARRSRSWRRLTHATVPFLEQSRALSSCFNNVVIPWSSEHDPSPTASPDDQVYKETAYGLVGSRARAAPATPTASTSGSLAAAAPTRSPLPAHRPRGRLPERRTSPASCPFELTRAPARQADLGEDAVPPRRPVRDPGAAEPEHGRGARPARTASAAQTRRTLPDDVCSRERALRRAPTASCSRREELERSGDIAGADAMPQEPARRARELRQERPRRVRGRHLRLHGHEPGGGR